ncbi:hypothetical protein [Flavobacterium psychrophilum]|nr:hypothetical protein [Flavobacterium psychrophilum]
MKNLESLGLVELNKNEAKEISGGFVWLAFLAGVLLVGWLLEDAFNPKP